MNPSHEGSEGFPLVDIFWAFLNVKPNPILQNVSTSWGIVLSYICRPCTLRVLEKFLLLIEESKSTNYWFIIIPWKGLSL